MSFIELEKKGAYALVKINRPDALNALNDDVLRDLRAAINDLSSDRAIRGVILTGAGEKAFCAGADIVKMKDFSSDDAEEFARRGHKTMNMIANSDLLSIAAINGFALGGGMELALACDIRIASKNAKLALPETGLGILPGFGGTQRLPRIAGMGNALEMILTGEQIDADAPEKLPLRLGDEGVAGADKNVDRIDALGPQRHRADRLDSAERVDRVGSSQCLGRDDCAGGPAFERRSAGDDARTARDLCRDNRHMSRSEQRILASRYVAARRVDRHVLVTQHDAGHGFDFHILQAVALNLREIAHLGLGELDIPAFLGAQAVDAHVDLGLRKVVVVPIPVVEADRHLAHGLVAMLFDFGQARLDDIPYLAIGICLGFRRRAALQPDGHEIPRT